MIRIKKVREIFIKKASRSFYENTPRRNVNFNGLS